jgi:hypothetical protein
VLHKRPWQNSIWQMSHLTAGARGKTLLISEQLASTGTSMRMKASCNSRQQSSNGNYSNRFTSMTGHCHSVLKPGSHTPPHIGTRPKMWHTNTIPAKIACNTAWAYVQQETDGLQHALGGLPQRATKTCRAAACNRSNKNWMGHAQAPQPCAYSCTCSTRRTACTAQLASWQWC